MSLLRTFIAVPLAPDLIREAETWQAAWGGPGTRGLRWTPPTQMHFTLAFLGAIDDAAVARAARAARAAAAAELPFRLTLGAAGRFPERGAPRVLWLGAGEGREEMIRLQARLAAGLAGEGLALEAREFVPHLTLGRIDQGSAWRENRPALPGASRAAQTVATLALMHSELWPDGARHTLAEEFPLGRTG